MANNENFGQKGHIANEYPSCVRRVCHKIRIKIRRDHKQIVKNDGKFA